jgi:hypothetical protein
MSKTLIAGIVLVLLVMGTWQGQSPGTHLVQVLVLILAGIGYGLYRLGVYFGAKRAEPKP